MADNVRALLWGLGYAPPQDIIFKIQRPMKCHLMHSIGSVCKAIHWLVGLVNLCLIFLEVGRVFNFCITNEMVSGVNSNSKGGKQAKLIEQMSFPSVHWWNHCTDLVLTVHKLHLCSVLTICILQYLTTVIPYDDCDGGPSNKVLLQLIESKSWN